MNLTSKGLKSGLLAMTLLLSSFAPALADTAQVTAAVPKSLKVNSIARVAPFATQTVTVDVLDKDAKPITDNTDSIALQITKGASSTVVVYDVNGNRIPIDSNGKYIVPAVSGEATFKITDNLAEQLVYSFVDTSTPGVAGSNVYAHFANVVKYLYSQPQIARNGELNAGDTKDVYVTAVDSANVGVAGSQVFLSLNQLASTNGFAGGTAVVDYTDPDTNAPTQTPLTATPKSYPVDNNGRVHIEYTAPATFPTSGVDTVTAQNKLLSPTIKATDTFTVDPLARYDLSTVNAAKGTIAATGMLNAGDVRTVTVTAADSKGLGVGKTTVYLSLTSTVANLGGGSAEVLGQVLGQGTLSSTPTPFVTDDNGKLSVTYTMPDGLPNGGVDTIVAQDKAGTSPKYKGTTTYTYASVKNYAFDQTTIATSGSLKAGGFVDRTVTVYNSLGKIMPNSPVYVLMTGTVTDSTIAVNGDPIVDPSTPSEFFTDNYGRITIRYTAPTPLPNGGTNTIVVQSDDTARPKLKYSATYTYANVASYNFLDQNGRPASVIAPTGSIAWGDQRTVTFVQYNNQSKPMPNTAIYLSLSGTGGGTATAEGKDLTTTPQKFLTGPDGSIDVVYSTPAVGMPSVGVDTLKVQDQDGLHPAHSKLVTYTYATLSNFAMSSFANPSNNPAGAIAATGTLAANAPELVTFKALDSSRKPMPNTIVYLSLTAATFGGAAKVNGTDLTTTPQAFKTDADGNIYVDYKTAVSLPSGGVDTIKIQDKYDHPTRTVTATYTYLKALKFLVDHTPIAATGQMVESSPASVIFTAVGTDNNPMANTWVYLSKHTLTGGGSFTVTDATGKTTTLTDTLQPFLTDKDGQVTVTYTTPNVLLHSGTESVTIKDSTASTAKYLTDSYTFR